MYKKSIYIYPPDWSSNDDGVGFSHEICWLKNLITGYDSDDII